MTPVVFAIGGPTGAGKTVLAVEIARRTGAVVLSCDAMQIYRGLNIGTGKASLEERGGILHFGIDVRDPDQSFDAADFMRLASQVLENHERVVVAGGTSLYLQALRRGLVPTPPADLERRQRWAGRTDLYEALTAVDPVLAERLHPNDHLRLIRGLEVWEDLGVRLSTLQAEHAARPDVVDFRGVWLDRSDLDSRIDARVHQMMDQGYLQEVEGLLQRFDRTLKPMRSLGYRHLAEHLLDELELDEAIRRTQRDTRRFARKQRTWRRHLTLPTHSPEQALALATELWDEV